MRLTFRVRMLLFAGSACIFLGLIAWTFQLTKKRFNEVEEKFASTQIESFRMGGKIREASLRLHDILYRDVLARDASNQHRFEEDGRRLSRWIHSRKHILNSRVEQNILQDLEVSLTEYLASGSSFLRVNKKQAAEENTRDLTELDSKLQHILEQAVNLTAAHEQSFAAFLEDGRNTFQFYGSLIYIALGGVMFFGLLSAVLVYVDMIAPLREELVRNKAVLERQEKLAALGILASGIVHEIRNPLTAVKAHLFSLGRLFVKDSKESKKSELIGQEIARLERVLQNFLRFASPSPPSFRYFSTSKILGELYEWMGPQFRENDGRIVLSLNVREDALSIRVDPDQMRQVLINLIQNAAESMPEGGKILISNRREQRHGQSKVLLEIADNGPGISPQIEKRLFDPFFTTKDSGTGLGLSIALRITKANGGSLEYETKQGRGTTFRLIFSEVQDPAMLKTSASSPL